ncbi:choline/ethanolamine kinase, putative, partial [Eimeria tenella]
WPFYSYLPQQMPNEELRRHLIEVYIHQTIARQGLSHLKEKLVTQETLNRFYVVVEHMMLVSHLVWAFWSIVRTKVPEDPESFSYLDYAKTRLELYSEKKKEMLASGII